ncbi:MAG: glutamate--tRNA ligase, partial [Clostridia bacterium]|nr:glutamate--tRNA ligase [Clostridia bacterium]
KNVICRKNADWVLERTLAWAKEYNPGFYALLDADREKARAILNIDRENPKPRKDIAKWADVPDYVAYFYDSLYRPDYSVLPEHIDKAAAVAVLEKYKDVWNIADDKDTWFARIKDICEPLGFTPNVKEYKANPEAYKGHVGDVSTIIRVAITSRTNTPDLYEIMKILGEAEVNARIENMINALS